MWPIGVWPPGPPLASAPLLPLPQSLWPGDCSSDTRGLYWGSPLSRKCPSSGTCMDSCLSTVRSWRKSPIFTENHLLGRLFLDHYFLKLCSTAQYFMCPFHVLVLSFSSVQSLSRVRLFATPLITARQASLSITNSRSSLKLTSIESVIPSSHLILYGPLLLLPLIPPSIRVFSNELTLCMRWPYCSSFSNILSIYFSCLSLYSLLPNSDLNWRK